MATNLMNILGMMGQQEPEYGSRAWRERAGQMRLPDILTADNNLLDLLHPTSPGQTQLQAETDIRYGTDPRVVQSALGVLGEPQWPGGIRQGEPGYPEYPGGRTPGQEYPYPQLWGEISGRLEAIGPKPTSFPTPLGSWEGVTSGAGYDTREFERLDLPGGVHMKLGAPGTGQVVLDILSGKRVPFTGSIARAWEAKQKRLEAGAESEIRKAERESPTGFITEAKRDLILRTAGVEKGPAEERAYIPAEELKPEEKPAKAPDKDTPIDDTSKDDVLVNNPQFQDFIKSTDPQFQAVFAEHQRTGEPIWDIMKRKLSEETGAGQDDLDTFMTDITQRLTEALDRKPGWPEFLMAFGMALRGQDGVGYLRTINQQYLGQAQVLGGLLGEARSEKSRREAMGLSASQAQAKAYAEAAKEYHSGLKAHYASNLELAKDRIRDLKDAARLDPIGSSVDPEAMLKLTNERDQWRAYASILKKAGKRATHEDVSARYQELAKSKKK